jgi:hypothetical protein
MIDAVAHHPRPWEKRPRAKDIAIETAPMRVSSGTSLGRGFKRRIIIKIPRTDDVYADHALADMVLMAFDLAEAAQDLVRDGCVDDFGQFTYSAPPRGRMDAIARLREVLSRLPPPRSQGAAFAA